MYSFANGFYETRLEVMMLAVPNLRPISFGKRRLNYEVQHNEAIYEIFLN